MIPNVQVVFGPPGTGKTTELMKLLALELERGTDPANIGFVTFTRAAREEVVNRVGQLFGLGPDQFPYLRTVHGTAFRLLGQPDTVVNGSHWKEFAETHGYRFTPTGRLDLWESSGVSPRATRDDLLRATYEWGRNRDLTVGQTLAASPHVVSSASFARFVERYEAFKRDGKLIDFHDLIETALRRGAVPPVEVAFIDEAQDLSPLQIRAVQTWFRHCRAVHIAGDDDQAIYGFQGANPDWLVKLARAHPQLVLAQSHRVPFAAHQLAERIIARNAKRVAKTYRPRAAQGSIDYLHVSDALKQIDVTRETLVLVRNRCFLKDITEDLQRRGVPYVVDGGGAANPLDPRMMAAARAALCLANGGDVEAEEFRKLLEFLPSAGCDLLPRGLKAAAETLRGTIRFSRIAELVGRGRLLQVAASEGPLAVFPALPPSTRRYLESVRARYGTFFQPTVHLTSIHGAKGREADLVVVLPDMTAATYRESMDQRNGGAEAENRVAYVGATRTKERLVICSPRMRNFYPYPRLTT